MLIHFWELPERRTYIKFNEEFNEWLFGMLPKRNYSKRLRDKIKYGKLSIKQLGNISRKEDISLETLEKNIVWLGGTNSRGLSNPKLPFNLSNRSGSRFISAIMNDGCLTKEDSNSYGRLMYDNFDESLRESVARDYINIFGGSRDEIAFRDYENKKFFEFSSVIRDIVALILKEKGSKCESNLFIPKFVFDNKETMCGWIEQVIADEGEVKFCLNKYRRSIIWRRSLDVADLSDKRVTTETSIRQLPADFQNKIQATVCNLIEGERRMLQNLGIKYSLYNIGVYFTIRGRMRTRWQINITQRENLKKLRDIIRIPSKEKDKKFTLATTSFVRYKEPLKIRGEVIHLGTKRSFTSIDLKKRMKYKNSNTALKWLKIFEEEKLIKKISASTYGNGEYRSPAVYALIRDK